VRTRHRAVVLIVALFSLGACTQSPSTQERPSSRSADTTSLAPSATPTAKPTPETDPVVWSSHAEFIAARDGVAYLAETNRVATEPVRCPDGCEAVSPLTWPASGALWGDRLFVGSEAGVQIFDLPCAHACHEAGRITFQPLDPASDDPNIRRFPPNEIVVAVLGDTLFVDASFNGATQPEFARGRLFAFDAGCALPCHPLWRSPLARGLGLPVVAGEEVLLPSSSGLFVFSRACRTDGDVCTPRWTAPMNTAAGIMDMLPPAVAGGRVAVLTQGYVGGGESDVPQLSVFPLACRTDGGLCPSDWDLRIDGARFAWGPLVIGSRIVVMGGRRSSGFIAPLDCGSPCEPARLRAPGEFFRAPQAVPGGFVVGSYDAGRLSLFVDGCRRAVCHPTASWRSHGRLLPTPVLAGRFVFVGTGRRVFALPVRPQPAGWHPVWDWRGRRRIEHLVVVGNTLLVLPHTGTIAVHLPDRLTR